MPPHHDRPTLLAPRHHAVPAATGTLGLWLFLASLAMLFAGSMLAYLLIRTVPEDAPPLGEAELPGGLWLSTAIIVASSFTLHAALQKLRRERQVAFRRLLLVTCVLALAFLVVQAPSLAALLAEHRVHLADDRLAQPAGLIFFLILVHAAHVVGGIVHMGIVTVQAHRHRYDHEHYRPVQHLAMYWHFLDIVWLVMFTTFLVAG